MIVPCLEKDSVKFVSYIRSKGKWHPAKVQMANDTPDMQKPSIWRRKGGSNLFYTIRCESFIHGWKTHKRQVKTSCFYEEYILTSLNNAIQTQVAEDAASYPFMCVQGRNWHFTPLVVPSN